MNGVEILTDRPTTDVDATGIMKALVYHGPGQRKWETTPQPTIRTKPLPLEET